MNRTSATIVRSLLLGTSALSALSLGAAHANPTGGTVAAGSATITNSGATTTIDQKTGKVVINWGSFSIGAGSTVQFNQPGSSSIALNRVTGDQPTSIYGNLLANGQVWIINGNGVLFGKGSQINVGGLIATTADINNNDFLSGDYSFNGATGASVVNQGTIRTKRGGSTVLSGANASNQGLIAADTGTVVIGGAKAFTVDFEGDGLLKYAITAPATNAKASNSGTISAAGGHVIMTARAANNVQDAVVNNTGMISATSAKVGQDGEVVLDGGDGDVAVSGSIDVSGTASGTTGGSVSVTGRNVTVADGTTINASGNAGGGTINIGGNLHGQGPLAHATNVTVGNATITADATKSGNGGQVVVWSDNDTDFGGSISAKGGASGGDGGMVETSGHNLNVRASATVNTLAPKGKTGDWLLDPTNIYIVDGDQGTLDGNGNAPVASGPTNDLLAPSTIVAALNTTDVSLQASNQIEVVSNINYSSSHTLSMLAEGNIIVLGNVQNAGTGAINMIAGWDGTTTDPSQFTNPGVYGNNSGSITFENDLPSAGISGHLATVGSAGGTVTLGAANLSLDGNDARVQIGFDGAGGGDIDILLTGGLTVDKEGGNDVLIGNGSFTDTDLTGNVTGNITINAPVTVTLTDNDAGTGHLWIGNEAGTTRTETGNVTLIGGTIDGNVDPAPFVAADLGGGDVTLGLSAGDLTIASGVFYNSNHDLTLLASGNLEILDTIDNNGAGNITLVAGWDGTSLGLNALSQSGAFGNNDGVLTIGGSDSAGHMYVGTHSGTLTVLTGDLDVSAINGTTQLGFGGAGTGDINITTTGNVDVLGGDPASDGPVAMIGNGTVNGFVDAHVGGNITINAGGSIILETAGGSLPPGNGNGSFGEGGGSGGLPPCGADCEGELPPGGGGDSLHFSGGGGGRPTALIGNSMGSGNGFVTGDVTLTAFDLDDTADSNGGFEALIANDIVNGNVTIGVRDSASFIEINRDLDYNSGYNLNILTAGGIGVDAVVQNDGFGNITLVAGWDGTTAVGDIASTTGSFGNNNAQVFLGDNCESCNYTTEIGTQFGTLSVFADTLIVDATDGYAQLGYHGGGQGNINVTVLDDVDVEGGNSSGFDAQIGNGGLENDVGSDVSGDITINAGGAIDVEGGDGGLGWIGNATSRDSTETGNVTLIASSLNISNANLIADLGNEFGAGGDVFIGINAGEGGYSFGGLSYDSAHSLTLASTGDLHIDGTTQNDGDGTINLVAGWDGQNVGIDAIEENGGWGDNGATLYIGGAGQASNISVGTASGFTQVLTDNLTIQPTGDLFGQLGYHGDGGGGISVVADGDITLEGGGSGSQYAQIGNGSIENGQVDGPATGDIYVYAGGTLNLISNNWIGNASDGGESGSVQIQAFDLGTTDNLPSMLLADVTGGDTFLGLHDSEATTTFDTAMEYNSDFALSLVSAGSLTIEGSIVNFGSGQVSVVAGWDGSTTDPTQLNIAGVYGNNGGGVTIGGANAAGAVEVSSVSGFTLAAGSAVTVDAENGNAQIGHAATGSGTIEVDATGALTLETNTDEGNLLAQIGNGASGATGTFGGDITVNADSLTMTAGDRDDVVMIGNGGADTNGTYTGDITVTIANAAQMESQASDQIVQIGDGGGFASGNADSTIILNAGSLDMTTADETSGSAVQIGNGGFGFEGTATGGITVGVTGALTLTETAGNTVLIGNLANDADGAPNQTGNVTITANSASDLADTAATVLAGGDLTVGITGGDYEWAQALDYDSSHTFSLLDTGSITFVADLQNSGSGGLNIVAGWDGTTTAPASFGNSGVYGNNGGSVTIGGGLANGNVAVGTALGQLNLYTDNLTLLANGGHAELGFAGDFAGTPGAIDVTAIDAVTLTGTVNDNNFAQIGNSQTLNDNSRAGDVGITADTIQQSGSAAIAADNLTLTTDGGDIGAESANIAVASNTLTMATSGGDAFVTSLNMGINVSSIDTQGGDVLLSAGGPIAQTGAISAGHLEVDTTGEDNAITLDNTGNVFSALSVDSSAGADIYDSVDVSVTAASVAEGQAFTLTSAGGITQTGTITADTFNVTSGDGDITLDDSDNAINQLSVTTTGGHDATIFSNENLNLQTISVAGTLTLNTTGAIQEASGITAGALNATAGESGITLDSDANDVTGDVSLNSGGDAVFHNDTDISLGASTVTGTLTLVSAGGITQDGAASAGTLSVTANGGAIDLENSNNAFGTLDVSTTADNDATFIDTGALQIDTANVGGTLTVTTDGEITQSSAGITAAALSATSLDSDIDFNWNNFVSGDVSLNASTNATFFNEGQLTLGASTVGGTLSVTSTTGGIGQDGAISAGTLTVASSGVITLTNDENAFGALNVTGTGGFDATFVDTGDLDIASADVDQATLSVTTDGKITQDSAITAAALSATSNNDNIVLDQSNHVSGEVSLNAAQDATFVNADDLILGASTVGGTLEAHAGTDISQDGAIVAGALSLFTNSGGIVLNDPDNSFATLDVSSKDAGAVSITDSTGVALDTISTGGDFTLNAGGDVTQTANALDLSGALSVSTTGGDITLDNDANAVSGTVTLNGPNDVAFTNVNATTLGASSAGGTMTITSGGAITQTGALSADTLNVLTTSGAITLDDTDNDFNTLLVTTNGSDNATIVDSTDLTIQSAGVGGTLVVTAASIGQSGAIAANALGVNATDGGITLQDSGNSFGSLSVTTQGSDAAVNDSQAVDIASANVGSGTFTLSADGAITQSNAITAGELDVSTTTGAITLTDTDNAFGALNVATTADDYATIVDTGDLTVTGATVGGTLRLTADSIEQTGEIDANAFGIIAANGAILDNTDNKFSGLEVTTTNSDATIADAWGIDIYSANTGTGALAINSGGHVTQEDDAPITAGSLTVSAGEGGIVLGDNNNVSGDASFSTSGDATFNNAQQITLNGGDVGGTLTLTSGDGIGQDGAFSAGTLTATAGEGTITLDNGDNNIGTVNLSTTSGEDTSVASATALTLGQIAVGGKLIVAAEGNVDQNQALALGNGMSITSGEGAIDLSNSGNAVSGTVTLHSAGDAIFANTLTTQVGASRTGGNLTLLSKGDVDVLDVVQSTSGNIVVVAGWDGDTTDPADLADAGVYGNNNGSLVIGGSGTTARAMLGAQSGSTGVYAYNVQVLGTNADAQLGYHGTGGGDISVAALNDVDVTAGNGTALIGNGSFGTDVDGDVTGDIDVRAAGSIDFTNSTDKSAWIGNRTLAGTETGNVLLIGDSIDGEGGADLGTLVAADIVGGDVTIGGTGTEDAAIGSGTSYTYNSAHTLTMLTAGNLAIEGSIQNTGTGAINIAAGWDGVTLDGLDADGATGIGGKGVTIGGTGATTNVAVGSFGGTTSVYGGSLTLAAVNGYAQLGFNGAGTGAVVVDVSGNVALNGGAATGDFAQIGNGGRNTSGNNGGDILITAGGDVVLTGGAGSEAYAQIGLGGAESNSNSTGYSNIGDIVVDATNVKVDAGTGTGAYAQIGNGGLKSGQNLNGKATDSGDIIVVATHAVSLLADGDDGYAQIGNGGSQSNLNPSASATGTDSGAVTVTAPNGPGGSVSLTGGAGANAYAQIGNGGYDMNAGATATAANFAVTGDVTVTDLTLNGSGINSYAQIGNGDVSDAGYGNVSGNIFIDANGNITYTNGTGTHSTATIGNFTGHGTVQGTVHGATPPTDGDGGGPTPPDGSDVNSNPATVGTIVTTQANNNQSLPITVINTIVVTIVGEDNGGASGLTASLVDNQPPGPLASLDTGNGDSEPPTTADSATVVIADSLDGSTHGSSTQTLLGGLLKQNDSPTGSHAVHAIPPADQDFSSWGNEALWQ